MSSKILYFVFCCVINVCLFAAPVPAIEKDPYPLFFLQRNLTNILVNDNIAPPVAARNYVYPQLAAFAVLSLEADPAKNILTAIKTFPGTGYRKTVTGNRQPATGYSASLAAAYAFYQVAEKLVYTSQPFTDSFSVLLDWYKKKGIKPAVFEASKRLALSISKRVIEWMEKDGFTESRTLNKYVLLKQAGKWQPTPPGYFAAVEPHWGSIRPMVLENKAALDQVLPEVFDTAAASGFYREALHVYTVSTTLTDEQKHIASFWDCNPFALRPVGHINAIVKKISPGGHWMNITGIACTNRQLDLYQTSRAFTLCAISLFDAFIYTWERKYRYDYLRPETFIAQTGIDNYWKPYLQSPPFPEFPSGHAVISNAAATVLTYLFGENFSYTDDSEMPFGIEARKFDSFQAAADEATISRLYGGIHFLFSCKLGQSIGKTIGGQLVDKLEKIK
jgi:membrane-associated phospholipid phosphatase